ncbi:MAG: hypothetical protein B7Y39_17860 [Bdellovibrio sp. 28-41-41]|nr:MAG: hypothetical protein B7Y39_17860 [Bdellovibrio sp. 28-41-41]
MKLRQLLVFSLALVFFTACGSKKDSTAQQPAEAQKAETAAPAPTISSEDAKKKAEAEKLAAAKLAKSKEGRGGAARRHEGKHKAEQGQKGSSASKGDSSDSFLGTQDIVITGGRSKSGMKYSGSAGDGILTQLLAEEKMKLAVDQDRNAVLAASIWDMSYVVDGQGELTLDIALTKGAGLSQVKARTQYSAGQVMSVVATTGSGSEIQLIAECLDTVRASDRCSNLLVKFVKNGAEATAVLRQTLANIWFEYDKVEQANEYATLVEFFKNSSLDFETGNKVDSAYLNTFEVVNGKSGFKVVVTGKRSQVLGFKADLLLKKNLSAPMISVDKETKFKGVDMWMGQIVGKDLSFMSSISNAKLVQNNTKGQITLDMTVKSASTGSVNSLTLRFTRVPVSASL